MHTYVTTEELKKKAFTVNSQNIKQPIVIQVTFILEVKLQKYIFIKIQHFFSDLSVHFEIQLGWECAYVCHDLITEKEEI